LDFSSYFCHFTRDSRNCYSAS